MLYNGFMRAREILKILKANGWVEERQKGSHITLKKNGIPVTVSNHGTDDIPKGTVKSIEKTTGLELLPKTKKKKKD
jgi:predicted RNA binding protein YcfA (HicA-like mRNA interferase family)